MFKEEYGLAGVTQRLRVDPGTNGSLSRSWHMPGLLARFPVGAVQEAAAQ